MEVTEAKSLSRCERLRFLMSYNVSLVETCCLPVTSALVMANEKPFGFNSLTHGSHETSTGSTLSFYYTHPSRITNTEEPVLVLLHGWPET